MPDAIDRLRRAADPVRLLVEGVHDDQWTHPTPCSEWDVAALVEHLTAGNLLFSRALVADETSTSEQPGDRKAAYRFAQDALLEAFSQTGVLDKIVEVPFGTVPGAVALELRVTELLTHGWDLARATGGVLDAPEDLLRGAVTFCEATLSQIPSGRTPFGPPTKAPGGAPTIDRLAALLGRDLDFPVGISQ